MSQTSDRKLRALFSKAFEGVVLYDGAGKIIYASPSCVNVTGFEETEILGKLGTDFVYHEDVPEAAQNFTEVIKTPNASKTFHQRLIHNDGHCIWVETTLSNYMHEPEVSGVISNFRDITAQKLAEEELRKSNTLLENINQNIRSGIYRNVPGESFKYVNQAFLEMFGFASLEDLNELEPSSLYVDQRLRKVVREHLLEKKGINNVEVEFRRKDGSTFWGLISSSFVTDTDGTVYFDGAIRDITHDKIAEEKLRKSEDFITSINRNIKEGLYRSSVERGLVYVNDTFVELFGFESDDEILATKVAELYENTEQRSEVVRQLKEEGAVSNLEVKFKKKDGTIFWGLMSSYLLKRAGEEFFDGAIRDITELKNVEERLKVLNATLQAKNHQLKKREGQLNQALGELSKRNFELDQLVYKTSHDLRSPLRSILGLINVSKVDTSNDSSFYFDKIEKSVKRLDEFIKSMLNYAQASRTEVIFEKVDIQKLIDSCIANLEFLENYRKVKSNVTISGSPYLLCDRLKLTIIFSNIISNAYKYMDASKEEPYLNITAVNTKSLLIVKITDNGVGIEEQHIPKIFDMFYRATEQSQGSGLGTYIVKQAVDRLGGTIEVESQPDVGTEFQITIPVKPVD